MPENGQIPRMKIFSSGTAAKASCVAHTATTRGSADRNQAGTTDAKFRGPDSQNRMRAESEDDTQSDLAKQTA
jgi:hypothetical protein